jgi:tetratricopeptide (TPR) repeat protein
MDDAEASYHKALSIRSDYTEAHSNLGALYNEWGKHEDAAASCRKALTINPDFAEAHSNLGGALQDLGFLDEAVASFRKALAIKPDCAEAHSNLGLISLLMGDFETGWPEYSWRQLKDDSVLKNRAYPQPFWDGEDLTGKTIFVYPEQGLGDIIQFVRYLPMVRQRGGCVAFDVPLSMVRLFRDLDGIDIALKHGDLLLPFDCHIPLLEFPRLFGTTLDTIPASAAYLHADKELTDAWAERLGPRQGFRIGLVWGGNPGHLNDHNRSIDPELFRPLIETPGVEAFSLMVGRDGEAARVFGDGLSDLAPHLGDFADTATAIAHLDLVISVDTAPAHLAGALGAPVWTLLPFNPDWRWMLDRDDSPWYPSMRLFRQETPGDWEGVFQEVETALRNEI